MIIGGFDLATNSGYAVRDSEKHRSSIECGVFSLAEYEWEEKYAIAANHFWRLSSQYKFDFVAIETPEHGVRQFAKGGKTDMIGEAAPAMTINPGSLQLSGIAGAIIAICMIRHIPYGLIPPPTWRSAYFGKGFKPARKITIDKKSGKEKQGPLNWKQAAIDVALQEGIILPANKADQKDAAEAIGICTCWHLSNVPNIRWMQDRFIELRTGAAAKRKAA